jgi:hypothetical protein
MDDTELNQSKSRMENAFPDGTKSLIELFMGIYCQMVATFMSETI